MVILHLKKNKGKIFFWQTYCRLTLHGHIFGDICFVYKQTIILLTNNPFVDKQSFCWQTILLLTQQSFYNHFVDIQSFCWFTNILLTQQMYTVDTFFGAKCFVYIFTKILLTATFFRNQSTQETLTDTIHRESFNCHSSDFPQH